jgi:hypothetical protein
MRLALEAALRRGQLRRTASNPDCNAGLLDRFSEPWDAAVQWSYSSNFYLRKNAAYLNWRYADHPFHKYRLFGAFQDGMPCAFAVTRGQNLVDVGYAHAEAFQAVLDAVAAFMRSEGILAVHSYLALSNAGARVFRNSGYYRANLLQPLLKGVLYPRQRTMARAGSNGISAPALNEWTFTMGDLDCKL